MYVYALFGGDPRSVHGFKSDYVLYLMGHPVRIRAWQVYFIYNRKYLKIIIQRKIYIRKRLGLYTLGSIHHEYRPVAGMKGSRHLIVKIHMARGIDKIEYVFISIVGLIYGPDGLRLDGYASFTFKIHVVEDLILHFPLA